MRVERAKQLGPYRIEGRVAAGGMAEVYVAHRLGPHGFQKRVALKCILPQHARDRDFLDMFIDEARLAARLEHPGIVQVFDFGEDLGALYIAMELVDGTSANRLMRGIVARGESVPLGAALFIASESARALAYAHHASDEYGQSLGIVHRDVSPANLLLTRRGHVKLTDFGIARCLLSRSRTEDGQVRGKLGYMSPEQVSAEELTGKSDVFALAVVLAELLIGEPLFGSGADIDVLLRIRNVDLSGLYGSRRQLPSDVRQLLTWALERHPEQRPDAAAFADAIDEIMMRRGYFGQGQKLVARMLYQLELVSTNPGDLRAVEPGARPTALLADLGGELEPPTPAMAAKVMQQSAPAHELSVDEVVSRAFANSSLQTPQTPQTPRNSLRVTDRAGARAAESVSPGLKPRSSAGAPTPRELRRSQVELLAAIAVDEPQTYEIQQLDGTVDGPLSYAELVRKIVTGEVQSQTLIRRGGADFSPSSEQQEFARYVRSPALAWDIVDRASLRDGVTMRGTIQSGALLALASKLYATRATGRLELIDSVRRKRVFFVEGNPTFVSSTDARELFGEFLIRKKICLPMEVEMALALMPKFKGRLGDALVGLEVLTPMQLYQQVAAQVRERYLESFRWTRGIWTFANDVRASEDSYALPHGATDLIRDSVMQADSSEMDAALDRVREHILTRSITPPAPLSAFAIPLEWTRILDKTAQPSTFSSLLAYETWQRGTDGALDTYRAIYFGLGCGFLATQAS